MGSWFSFVRRLRPAVTSTAWPPPIPLPPPPPPAAPRRDRPVAVRPRNYPGAVHDRLTADWMAGTGTADEALSLAFATLRNRARSLEREDDMVRRMLRLMESNVVGHLGLRYRPQPRRPDGTIDEADKRILEREFKRWARPQVCSMDGRLSWIDLQAMSMRRILVDGEMLIRIHRGRVNEYGLALEALDPMCLDDMMNVEPGNGRNRIVMGVEMDGWNRPLAYHLLKDPRRWTGAANRERVPARDILHLYLQERPGQTRGVTWLASGMLRKRMLDAFELATVVGARVAANKMGFYTRTLDAAGELGAEEDAAGELLRSSEAGELEELPPGYQFQEANWDYPPAGYAEFVGAMKRGLAAGWCVSYHTVAQDYSGISYSSIRHGELTDRDLYRMLQRYLEEHAVTPVTDEWVLMGITSGRLPFPITKLEKFLEYVVQPRGWQWVDPAKEVAAAERAFTLGVNSLTRIAAEGGGSIEDIREEIAQERASYAAAGIPLPGPAKPAEADGAKPAKPAAEDEAED